MNFAEILLGDFRERIPENTPYTRWHSDVEDYLLSLDSIPTDPNILYFDPRKKSATNQLRDMSVIGQTWIFNNDRLVPIVVCPNAEKPKSFDVICLYNFLLTTSPELALHKMSQFKRLMNENTWLFAYLQLADFEEKVEEIKSIGLQVGLVGYQRYGNIIGFQTKRTQTGQVIYESLI